MKNRRPVLLSYVVACLPVLTAVASGCGGDPGTTIPDVTLTLTNVPTGCPTSETADDLYTTVVAGSCSIANCHGSSNANSFHLLSAADLNSQLVGKPSTLYSGVKLPLVTASDINKSWIMYKLTGSQGPFGSKMPLGKTLTNDQICKFVAWINTGAK